MHRSRINAYRALASPSLIALSSKVTYFSSLDWNFHLHLYVSKVLLRFFQNIFSRAFRFEFCLFFCLRTLFISNFHFLHKRRILDPAKDTYLVKISSWKQNRTQIFIRHFFPLSKKILPNLKKTFGTKPFSPPSAFLWICPQPDNIWEFYITYSVEHTALGILKSVLKTDLAAYVFKG